MLGPGDLRCICVSSPSCRHGHVNRCGWCGVNKWWVVENRVDTGTSGKSAPAHRSPVRYVAKNIHFCVINHSRALKNLCISSGHQK